MKIVKKRGNVLRMTATSKIEGFRKPIRRAAKGNRMAGRNGMASKDLRIAGL
jgi:hypothetical protein